RGASEPPQDASPGVARPQAERRDVTLLLVEIGARGALPAGLRAQAERFGGRPLEPRTIGSRDGRYLGLLFAVDQPDGRDAEAAARWAHALRAATGLDAPLAIHSGRLLVTLEGEILVERRYDVLFERAASAIHATGKGETVLTL